MRSDQRDLLAAILNALPQAALLVEPGGEVILRNATAESALPPGRRADEVLGGDGASGIHWATEMADLAAAAGQLLRRNVRLSGRGSRQFLVDLHFRAMGGRAALEEGAIPPGCVLVLVEDVSGRATMERRLLAGERLAAAGMVAAKVAHELNNPLDGVLRFISLAERAGADGAARYLAGARAGLLRMAETIRGLREQGRPWQAGGERLPVRRLLEEAIEAMQPRAQALGVSVLCDLDDRADGAAEGAVFQVFCNVIKNSLDAMPEGGRLTVRLRLAGQQCEVEFADTGCGLAAEEAERIFEPFYTTKAAGGGSGLGLTICRDILTRLGGAISARPRAEGGAVIAIRLPTRGARKPPGPEE